MSGEQNDVEKIGKQLQEVERRGRIRDLVSELGLEDQKQGELVLNIMSMNPDLAPPEALGLAAKRAPDVFKDHGGGGFNKNTHGSLRPTPGHQPRGQEPSEFKQRMAYAQKLAANGHKDVAQEVALDLIADAACKVIGWGKYPQRIPLPAQW